MKIKHRKYKKKHKWTIEKIQVRLKEMAEEYKKNEGKPVNTGSEALAKLAIKLFQ